MPDNPENQPSPAPSRGDGGGGNNGGKFVATGSAEPEGIRGIVRSDLGEGLFLVLLDSGIEVRAHLSGQARVSLRAIRPGGRVLVDISPYDAARGRILKQLN